MSGIANKVKDTLGSNKNTTEDPYSTTTTHGTHTIPRTTGTHNVGSGAGAQVPLGQDYTHTSSGPAPKTDGPHKSDILNKADPRVDSDRDYSKNMGMNPHGTADTDRDAYDSVRHTTGTATTGGRGLTGAQTGTTIGPNSGPVYTGSGIGNTSTTTGGLTGSHGTSGTTGNSGLREGAVGPHGSRMANAADPRVDSDLDNSRTAGSTRTTGTTGAGGLTGSHGISGTHGTTGGISGTHGSHSTTRSGLPEGTTGPHSSRAANAADPRVDSDLDNSHTVGSSQTHHTPGTTTTTGTTGHSTTGHSSGVTGSNVTTGPAPNTAGPHKSDMLNKLDPRVDSNLDGSKTVGGNKTFAGSNVDNTGSTH